MEERVWKFVQGTEISKTSTDSHEGLDRESRYEGYVRWNRELRKSGKETKESEEHSGGCKPSPKIRGTELAMSTHWVERHSQRDSRVSRHKGAIPIGSSYCTFLNSIVIRGCVTIDLYA